VETRSHSTLFLLLPSPARQKMLRDENLSARETVRRIPATSVTLFREASVEDACDMEASSQKPPIDRMVHGNFAYRHPLPHVPRCLGHCADPPVPTTTSYALVPYPIFGSARSFRYACTLRVRLILSDPPAFFGHVRSSRSVLRFPCGSGPVCAVDSSFEICSAGNGFLPYPRRPWIFFRRTQRGRGLQILSSRPGVSL